jgi:hypothetical protein
MENLDVVLLKRKAEIRAWLDVNGENYYEQFHPTERIMSAQKISEHFDFMSFRQFQRLREVDCFPSLRFGHQIRFDLEDVCKHFKLYIQ